MKFLLFETFEFSVNKSPIKILNILESNTKLHYSSPFQGYVDTENFTFKISYDTPPIRRDTLYPRMYGKIITDDMGGTKIKVTSRCSVSGIIFILLFIFLSLAGVLLFGHLIHIYTDNEIIRQFFASLILFIFSIITLYVSFWIPQKKSKKYLIHLLSD